MLLNITFNLIPIAFVVTNFFTSGADGQKTTQGFDFSKRAAKFVIPHL